MRVELYHADYPKPEIIEGILSYIFDDDCRLLWLYDVKDTKDVDPVEIIIVDHWARIKFANP